MGWAAAGAQGGGRGRSPGAAPPPALARGPHSRPSCGPGLQAEPGRFSGPCASLLPGQDCGRTIQDECGPAEGWLHPPGTFMQLRGRWWLCAFPSALQGVDQMLRLLPRGQETWAEVKDGRIL